MSAIRYGAHITSNTRASRTNLHQLYSHYSGGKCLGSSSSAHHHPPPLHHPFGVAEPNQTFSTMFQISGDAAVVFGVLLLLCYPDLSCCSSLKVYISKPMFSFVPAATTTTSSSSSAKRDRKLFRKCSSRDSRVENRRGTDDRRDCSPEV